MPDQQTRSYYADRALAARRSAAMAASAEIAAIHVEIAVRYERLANKAPEDDAAEEARG